MIDLAWQIPVFALAGAALFRIVLAPYELWKEQRDRADVAEERVQAVEAGYVARAELMSIIDANTAIGDTNYFQIGVDVDRLIEGPGYQFDKAFNELAAKRTDPGALEG